MRLSKMQNFRKCEDCPSSVLLLKFQNGGLAAKPGREIERHLVECEFCSTEVGFYSRYPQAEGASETAEIPAPLYELAESLLMNRQRDPSSLDSLLKERGSLAVDRIK